MARLVQCSEEAITLLIPRINNYSAIKLTFYCLMDARVKSIKNQEVEEAKSCHSFIHSILLPSTISLSGERGVWCGGNQPFALIDGPLTATHLLATMCEWLSVFHTSIQGKYQKLFVNSWCIASTKRWIGVALISTCLPCMSLHSIRPELQNNGGEPN